MLLHNDLLDVELDESNLALSVTDRRSGVCWRTPGPGFGLQVYDGGLQACRWLTSAGFDITKAKYGDNQQSRCTATVDRQTDTHARVTVDLDTVDLGFAVDLTLDGGALRVRIPHAGWNHNGEKANEVIALDVFQGFGGRPAGAEGCLVLPHFGGALRYFADDDERCERMRTALDNDSGAVYSHAMGGTAPVPASPQSYVAMTYGYQPNWRDLIVAPLWGAIAGDSGWAAYVPFECGDCDTGIVSTANRGSENWCAVHARFCYREHAHDRRIDEDRELVFTFLHECGIDYSAVAKVYRDYLLAEVGVPTLREKAAASPQTAYLAGAYYLRPMLALKRFSFLRNPNPDGKGILDVYMTCDELATELARWRDAGIDKALVQIVGANSEGHDGNYPTYFPLEAKVGGEEGVRRLVDTLHEVGYRTSMHLNIRCYMRGSLDFRIESILRDRHGSAVFSSSGPGGDDYHGCPAATGPEFTRRNFGRLADLGLNGGMYTDFMLGVLFRCYHPDHPLTRRGYLDACKRFLRHSKDVFGAARTECIIAPLLDTNDCVSRLYATTISRKLLRGAELTARGLADDVVPLMLLVCHGIVMHGIDNCCLGEKDYWAHFLDLVSVGGKPIEELRGPQPQWDEFHAFQYRILCERLGWLQFEFIDGLTQHGTVTRTVYSDGTVVLVNHGEEAAVVDGENLAPRSFRVRPSEGHGGMLYVEEDPSLCQREAAVFPNGSVWPDGRPREGVVKTDAPESPKGVMMIGQDFA